MALTVPAELVFVLVVILGRQGCANVAGFAQENGGGRVDAGASAGMMCVDFFFFCWVRLQSEGGD